MSRSYIDETTAVILLLKEDGTVSYINKAGCVLLGYNRYEIIGANWIEAFLPDGIKEWARKYLLGFFNHETNLLSVHDSAVLTKSGEIRHVKWSPSFLEGKKSLLISGIEITDGKALQLFLARQDAENRKKVLSASVEAQENERQRISNELHDNVGQLLTTCKLILEVEISKTQSTMLSIAYDSLQQSINIIRSLSHQLNPAKLNGGDLVFAIKELVGAVGTAGNYKVDLEIKGERHIRRIDPLMGLSAFRIIQEQFNNIVKHAHASQIVVTIIGSSRSLNIEIRDNGKGFDTKQFRKGLGLINIYSRAELFQGCVYICSSKGEGCLLSVCLPFN